MSMPEIPEEKYRPTRHEVMIDLLESIALEEIALAHLLNAEAEKIQTFVGMNHRGSKHQRIYDFLRFNHSSTQFVRTLLMKEWILLTKLENILEFPEAEECERIEECEEFEE